MAAKRPKVHIYSHVAVAVILSSFCSYIISQHASAIAPDLVSLADAGAKQLPRWASHILLAMFVAYYAAARVWVRPVHLFLNKGKEEYKEKARARASGFYRFIILITALSAGIEILIRLITASSCFPGLALGALLAHAALRPIIESYYSAYLIILYFEPVLFNLVMPRLYEGEDLYSPKPGATLSIRLKLWLMVLNLVIIPMVLVSVTLLQHREALADIWPVPFAVILMALCFIVGYSEVLYRSITRPLGELLRKMGLVAQGDFQVRTSVLGGDEIGRIKVHFNRMVDELAERECIKDTFGKYVSVEIAKQLIETGSIELGGRASRHPSCSRTSATSRP